MDEILHLIESVFEGFPTYSFRLSLKNKWVGRSENFFFPQISCDIKIFNLPSYTDSSRLRGHGFLQGMALIQNQNCLLVICPKTIIHQVL